MPRNRPRTTDRGLDLAMMQRAARSVEKGHSIRSIAKDFNINHVSLYRFIQKKKAHDEGRLASPPSVGYNSHNRVFSPKLEEKLCQYILESSDIYYGLSPKDIRKLAFKCAKFLGIDMPNSWKANQQAGSDWFSSFMKRNSQLSIRKPQATSLARATAFNEVTVKEFFDNLEDVMKRFKFTPNNIYNADETGVTTVQVPTHIVAAKGKKQVGAITSQERGTLVTMMVAINGTGNSIPPMFIFPRKNFKDHFIRDGPTGCIGTANGSGWMQGDDFLIFIKLIIQFF